MSSSSNNEHFWRLHMPLPLPTASSTKICLARNASARESSSLREPSDSIVIRRTSLAHATVVPTEKEKPRGAASPAKQDLYVPPSNRPFCKGLGRVNAGSRAIHKHVMRQDCQLLSHSPIDLLGFSATTAKAIPLPSMHGVSVHIGEDLWAPPLRRVFLPPTMSKKSVGQTQEPVNVMFGHMGPLERGLCTLKPNRFNSPARRS